MKGVFSCSLHSKFLENLVFNDIDEDINENMTESNIGTRGGRNIKDHLIVINGIINNAAKGKEEDCIKILTYDLEKAFDSLWLEDCCLNLFYALEEKYMNAKWNFYTG